MEAEEILSGCLDDYFERVGRLDYDHLARVQTEGRLASLSHGAAGVAYAHLHVALVRGRRELLDGADRWVRAAWERRDDETAFFPGAGGPRRHLATGAFVFGLVGVVAVRAMIAHARGEAAELDRALDDLAGCCRTPSESFGLFAGTAGALQAVSLLYRATGDRRPAALGEELSGRLSRRAAPLDGGPIAWRAWPGPALAHGAAGALLAALSWCGASGSPPGPALRRGIDEVLETALEEPALYCPRPTFVASVCNGFAGLATLALEAYAVLGEPRHLAAARRAVEIALGALPPRLDLCCGRCGPAAACLALAAVDPGGPWRRHARELILSALLREPDEWEIAGLYGGEAAIPCLAADLLAAAPVRGLPALVWPARPGETEGAARGPHPAASKTAAPEAAVPRPSGAARRTAAIAGGAR